MKARYRVVIYFLGSLSKWAERPHPNEILFEQQMPWLWLARFQASQLVKPYISGRVGWAICDMRGEAVEQFQPEPI